MIYSRRDGPKEVELKCAFDGHPVPTVTIKRPDKKKVAIRQGSASYQFYTREYGDYGFYECEGKNDAGTGRHHMEVYEAGEMSIVVFQGASGPLYEGVVPQRGSFRGSHVGF